VETRANSRLNNLRWLTGGNLAVKPLWFLFLLFSTRALGPEEFGRFMVALSFVGIVWTLFEGGVDLYTMRALSVDAERFRHLFSLTTSLKVALGLLMAVVVMISVSLGAVPADMQLLLALATVHCILNAVMVHVRYVFRAFEIMKLEAISVIAEKLSVVVICALTFLVAARAEVFMGGYVIAYLLSAGLTLWMVVRTAGSLRPAFSLRPLWNDVLRPALPFAMMTIFTVIYYRSGTLMLQWLTGDETLVGYYNAGYRLVESFALLPSIIVMPLYATFARSAGDRKEIFRLVERSLRAVLVISLLIAVPLTLFRKEVTALFFGEKFAPAAPALGVIVLTMIPVGMGWLFSYLAGAVNRQRRMNYYIVIVTVLNLVLNAVLIGRYGVMGAAVTTLLTEGAITLSALWVVRDYMEAGPLVRIGAAAAGVTALVVALGWGGLYPGPFPVQLCEAGLLLVGGFVLAGLIRPAEIRTFLGL
jgi:O-antigen/teichoic acid export membrane protein